MSSEPVEPPVAAQPVDVPDVVSELLAENRRLMGELRRPGGRPVAAAGARGADELADQLRDLAETWLYDGDTDNPRGGYHQLLDLADSLVAASLPVPTEDDDEGNAHVTETYRQTINGREQLGWQCVTCLTHQLVCAGPGMGKPVPAADVALLDRLAAEHVIAAAVPTVPTEPTVCGGRDPAYPGQQCSQSRHHDSPCFDGPVPTEPTAVHGQDCGRRFGGYFCTNQRCHCWCHFPADMVAGPVSA